MGDGPNPKAKWSKYKVEDGKLNHGRTLTGILDNTSRMRQEMSGDVHRNKVFG